MIEFGAVCFDGTTSKPHEVRVSFEGALLRFSGPTLPERAFPAKEVIIRPPLAGLRRVLLLPDGVRCETEDRHAVQRLEGLLGRNRSMGLVHVLEKRWKAVLGCFALLLACVAAFTTYGLPYLARTAAASLPPTLIDGLSRKTLELLDTHYMEPSELSPVRQEELTARFERELRDVETPVPCRVLFRKSRVLGPNALALPSGTIVFTDELVDLARDDVELVGVLMHEAAHVRHRHAMRSLLQNAGIVMLVSLLMGDAVSVTSTAAALPMLLMELGYSREFEREADRTAANALLHKGYGTVPLQTILERLSKAHDHETKGANLLSTHPNLQERIELLRTLELEWRHSGHTVRRIRPERLAVIPGMIV